jgi:murein DD-endopeptidase MepM/ murein hydrolase activator NlpD
MFGRVFFCYMARRRFNDSFYLSLLALSLVLGVTLACSRSLQDDNSPFWSISRAGQPTVAAAVAAQSQPIGGLLPPVRTPGAPVLTPTPDAPHSLPAVRTQVEQYTVAPGDTLGQIAVRFGVSVDQIAQENELANANLLEVGQTLIIPIPDLQNRGPGFKIIPDSELVNGPYSILFDVEEFVQMQGGFLASYYEEIGDQSYSGAQIVQQIARDYSVNPRLLLAALEHQSGWLTNPQPKKSEQDYPMGWADPQRKGLFRQLSWAANSLNRGYYLWRASEVGTWILPDGSVVPIDPTINAGTAAVQHFYALLYDRAAWEKNVSPDGLFATYNALFGYPFDYAIEPLLPADLLQPTLQLPFEPGATWYFTGGPHSGWGDGSAWAALDFAPPGEALGCVQNDAWVTAVANGLILRSENGVVMQDLDGDGLEQTGWVILYLHIDTRDRVPAGTMVQAGQHVGHPSCEGGVSSGTHLHLARKYNGEWIPAGHTLPFILDGWLASGTGKEYDGYLTRKAQQLEAYAGISSNNGIVR